MDDSDLGDAYTDLEGRVKAVPIEATSTTLKTFADLIEESNDLIKQVKATEEVIKDAWVVSTLTASIHESTKCINVSESSFDPDLFTRAVANLVANADEESYEPNWEVLSTKSSRLFRSAPGFTYITAFNGDQPAQAAKVVERKERQARKPLEQRKEPEKVKTITKTNEGVSAVDKIFQLLYRCYRQNGKNPVCIFQFVIDPNSFSKTIENIFHLSFLARDGLVQISLNNQKLPVLTPLAPEQTNNNTSNREKIQTLMSITQTQWREICNEFNIKEALIP